MKIQYPILVDDNGPDTAIGVMVPDLPGCFSTADHHDQLLDKAREAILVHMEALEEIPEPSSMTELDDVVREYEKDADGKVYLMLVDVDLSLIHGPTQRINITAPQGALHKIDAAAKRAGKSRSAFLIEAGLRESG